MPFQPDTITREHVEAAVRKIRDENIELKTSTGYDVIINGEAYHPAESYSTPSGRRPAMQAPPTTTSARFMHTTACSGAGKGYCSIREGIPVSRVTFKPRITEAPAPC